MKFLEARKQNGHSQTPSIALENKMRPGSRLDQKDPVNLISSLHKTARPESKPVKEPGTVSNVEKMAKSLGVDLSTVTGTGPDGQITEKDVRLAKRAMQKAND